jgi:anti-anti-sigma regulatory factor
MLKITNSLTANEKRWILCGQLAGPWVPELRSNWNEVRECSRGRTNVVDLTDVTFIDKSGAALLRQLRDEGAEFVARGVEIRHLLENLGSPEEPPVRCLLSHLSHGRRVDR